MWRCQSCLRGLPVRRCQTGAQLLRPKGRESSVRPVRVDRRHGLLRPREVKRAEEGQPVEGLAAMWGPDEVSC